MKMAVCFGWAQLPMVRLMAYLWALSRLRVELLPTSVLVLVLTEGMMAVVRGSSVCRLVRPAQVQAVLPDLLRLGQTAAVEVGWSVVKTHSSSALRVRSAPAAPSRAPASQGLGLELDSLQLASVQKVRELVMRSRMLGSGEALSLQEVRTVLLVARLVAAAVLAVVEVEPWASGP